MNGRVEWRVVGGWIRRWWEGWWLPWGSSQVAMGISGTGSCCLREIRSLFELPVRIPLKSLPVNRAVSGVQSGDSVFLSGGDRDLGLPIKVQ